MPILRPFRALKTVRPDKRAVRRELAQTVGTGAMIRPYRTGNQQRTGKFPDSVPANRKRLPDSRASLPRRRSRKRERRDERPVRGLRQRPERRRRDCYRTAQFPENPSRHPFVPTNAHFVGKTGADGRRVIRYHHHRFQTIQRKNQGGTQHGTV